MNSRMASMADWLSNWTVPVAEAKGVAGSGKDVALWDVAEGVDTGLGGRPGAQAEASIPGMTIAAITDRSGLLRFMFVWCA